MDYIFIIVDAENGSNTGNDTDIEFAYFCTYYFDYIFPREVWNSHSRNYREPPELFVSDNELSMNYEPGNIDDSKLINETLNEPNFNNFNNNLTDSMYYDFPEHENVEIFTNENQSQKNQIPNIQISITKKVADKENGEMINIDDVIGPEIDDNEQFIEDKMRNSSGTLSLNFEQKIKLIFISALTLLILILAYVIYDNFFKQERKNSKRSSASFGKRPETENEPQTTSENYDSSINTGSSQLSHLPGSIHNSLLNMVDPVLLDDQKNKTLLPLKITKTCRKLSFRFSKWYFYAGEELQEKNCNPRFPKKKSSIRKKVIRNSKVNLLNFIPSFESLRCNFFRNKKQIPRKISLSLTNEILSRS